MRNAEREAQITVLEAFMPGSLITLWRMSNDYLQTDATQATQEMTQ